MNHTPSRHQLRIVTSKDEPRAKVAPRSRNAILMHHLDTMLYLHRVDPAKARAVIKFTNGLARQVDHGRRAGQR